MDSSTETMKKQKKGAKKWKQAKQQDDDSNSSSKRSLWIALGVLAALAILLWYLNREGYLQRWMTRRFAPSAPPYEGF